MRGNRWAAFGRRAVVLHRGPLTSSQRRWVAVLNAGTTATLAGLTAAEELGLTGFETETIHVVVRKDDWVPRDQPGVKVHVSRRFTVDDRHPARALPVVRIDRALVDAATWTARPRRAAAILVAGVQQRLALPDRLRNSRGPCCRRRRGVIAADFLHRTANAGGAMRAGGCGTSTRASAAPTAGC